MFKLFKNKVKKEIEIQLPQNREARRCVLIVVEDFIGIIVRIEINKGLEYAIVLPHKK